MGTLRFADLQTRPMAVLDLTSLTVEEFHLKAEIRDAVMDIYCGVREFPLQYRPWYYDL
jgi:hypothetical protein